MIDALALAQRGKGVRRQRSRYTSRVIVFDGRKEVSRVLIVNLLICLQTLVDPVTFCERRVSRPSFVRSHNQETYRVGPAQVRALRNTQSHPTTYPGRTE